MRNLSSSLCLCNVNCSYKHKTAVFCWRVCVSVVPHAQWFAGQTRYFQQTTNSVWHSYVTIRLLRHRFANSNVYLHYPFSALLTNATRAVSWSFGAAMFGLGWLSLVGLRWVVFFAFSLDYFTKVLLIKPDGSPLPCDWLGLKYQPIN